MLNGSKDKGLKFAGFQNDGKLVILVMGGSLGAQRINNALLKCLPELVKKYKIIHLTGPDKTIYFDHPNYKSFEYVSKEMPDVLACADLVVSRAGANSIFEFLAVRKPMLLIPLEIGSRGDQVDNAESFANKGWAYTLNEKQLDEKNFISAIEKTIDNRDMMSRNQSTYQSSAASQKILSVIENAMKA